MQEGGRQLRFTKNGKALIAHPSGEIDLANAGDMREELLAAIDEDTWHLLLDLSDVTYMDSSGVRVLFDVSRVLATKRRQLGIVLIDGSPLEKLFKVTHVNEAALVCSSVEECLETFASID